MDDLASMGQTLDGALQLLKVGSQPELADDSRVNVFEAQQAIDFVCLPKKVREDLSTVQSTASSGSSSSSSSIVYVTSCLTNAD